MAEVCSSTTRMDATILQGPRPFWRATVGFFLRATRGRGRHNLWLHFGVDEHPFATYFDVHQGYHWL